MMGFPQVRQRTLAALAPWNNAVRIWKRDRQASHSMTIDMAARLLSHENHIIRKLRGEGKDRAASWQRADAVSQVPK